MSSLGSLRGYHKVTTRSASRTPPMAANNQEPGPASTEAPQKPEKLPAVPGWSSEHSSLSQVLWQIDKDVASMMMAALLRMTSEMTSTMYIQMKMMPCARYMVAI